MKIAIESTEKVTRIDGALCRVWHGVTERGTPCTVFVHRLAVAKNEDTDEFDRELRETLPPGELFDLRGIL